jgi:hypothetical protein
VLAGLTAGGCAEEKPAPRAPVERRAEVTQRAPAPPAPYESYGPQGSAYRPYGANPAYSQAPRGYSPESYPPPSYSERWPERPVQREPPRASDRGYAPGQDPWGPQWPEREDERRWGAESPRYGTWNESQGRTYPSPTHPYYEPETKPGFPSGTGTFNVWEYQKERPWGRPDPSRRDRGRRRADEDRQGYRGRPAAPAEPLPYVPPVVPPYLRDPYGYPGDRGYPGGYYTPGISGYPADSAWY